jgi:hypothetical protein
MSKERITYEEHKRGMPGIYDGLPVIREAPKQTGDIATDVAAMKDSEVKAGLAQLDIDAVKGAGSGKKNRAALIEALA